MALKNRGVLFYKGGDYDRALADLNEAHKGLPQNADVLADRAQFFSA